MAGGPGGPAAGPGGPGGRDPADPADQAADPVVGGAGGGPRPVGVDLDPLVGLDDARKPLRSRLLAVPSLKARYLDHVRTIAEEWLDWNRLGPVVARYRALIEKEVEHDTRKLTLAGRVPQGRRRRRRRNRRPAASRRTGLVASGRSPTSGASIS